MLSRRCYISRPRVVSILRLAAVPSLHAALGPVLLALVRGELPLLWSYTEAPAEDKDKKEKLDDTIEAPSAAAIAARKAVANGQASDAVQHVSEHVEEQEANAEAEPEDDSWMEDGKGVGSGVEGAKARKRKGGKKK